MFTVLTILGSMDVCYKPITDRSIQWLKSLRAPCPARVMVFEAAHGDAWYSESCCIPKQIQRVCHCPGAMHLSASSTMRPALDCDVKQVERQRGFKLQ